MLLTQVASLLLRVAQLLLARNVAQNRRSLVIRAEHRAISAAPVGQPPLDPLERHTPANSRWVASGSAPVKSGLRLALRATADAALLTGGCASGYGAIRSRTPVLDHGDRGGQQA